MKFLLIAAFVIGAALVPGPAAETADAEHPDFSLNCAPSAVAVVAGSSAEVNCQAASLGGFAGPVTLDCQGGPPGISCLFQPNPLQVPPDANAVGLLTIATDLALAEGDYTLTVVAAAGTALHQLPLSVKVTRAVPCKCVEMSIKPLVANIPTTGAVNGGDSTAFDVTITVNWTVDLTCAGDPGACIGQYTPKAKSTWAVDNKESTEGVVESLLDAAGGAKVRCIGKCEGTQPQSLVVTTVYKAKVTKAGLKKGKGKGTSGDVLNKVDGTVTLTMTPDCGTQKPWIMILAYQADVKKKTATIDEGNSDYDGDGFVNKVENAKGTDPLDPASKPTK